MQDQKKEYMRPVLVIDLFEGADIVCASNTDEDEEELDWFRPEEEDE